MRALAIQTVKPKYLDAKQLRSRFGEILDKLSAQLMTRYSETTQERDGGVVDALTARLQTSVGRIGQIVAGLGVVSEECLPARGAGYGSSVIVKNMKTGEVQEYMLMVGSLLDVSAHQVSLASPIGQALIGRTASEDVKTMTPQGEIHLRVLRVRTLLDMLEDMTT